MQRLSAEEKQAIREGVEKEIQDVLNMTALPVSLQRRPVGEYIADLRAIQERLND
jgi:hypothetical protein